MLARGKRYIGLCVLLVLLVAAIPSAVSGTAAQSGRTECFSAESPWERLLVDRVNLALDSTDFLFLRSEGNRYVLRMTLTAAKTEADFYAKLDSMELLNFPYDLLYVTAAPQNGDIVAIDDAELPIGVDFLPQTLQWTIELVFTDTGTNTESFAPVLRLGYTSGTKYALADASIVDIPLTVKLCSLAPLPTVMGDAEKLFTYNLYTEESLAALRALLDEIYVAMRSPGDISAEQINTWVLAIGDATAALVFQ